VGIEQLGVERGPGRAPSWPGIGGHRRETAACRRAPRPRTSARRPAAGASWNWPAPQPRRVGPASVGAPADLRPRTARRSGTRGARRRAASSWPSLPRRPVRRRRNPPPARAMHSSCLRTRSLTCRPDDRDREVDAPLGDPGAGRPCTGPGGAQLSPAVGDEHDAAPAPRRCRGRPAWPAARTPIGVRPLALQGRHRVAHAALVERVRPGIVKLGVSRQASAREDPRRTLEP